MSGTKHWTELPLNNFTGDAASSLTNVDSPSLNTRNNSYDKNMFKRLKNTERILNL